MLLDGDDTIHSSSAGARIHAGDGNDTVFISGEEEIIDGGTGSNIATIDGSGKKMILGVFGDGDGGDAQVGDTKLKNFNTYFLTGSGHEVIIDPAGLVNTIPVFVAAQGTQMILRNPSMGNGEQAVVIQGRNKIKQAVDHIYKYTPDLKSIEVAGKVVAMQREFVVSTAYDD